MKFPSLLVRPIDLREPSELLRAYAEGDHDAFEELVTRFGPLVLSCCRRILGHADDADDAFQSTFLILAKKSHSIAHPERLAGWLHSVATRVATELRKSRTATHRVPDDLAPFGKPILAGDVVIERTEEIQALDEEISRLPDHYRLPVILCELQTRSRSVVARELRIHEGTLSSRLAMARKILARRMSQRGFSSFCLTGLVTSTAVAQMPGHLATSSLPSACSETAHQLAKEVMNIMIIAKIKTFATATLVAMLTVGSAISIPYGLPGASIAQAEDPVKKPSEKEIEALILKLGSFQFKDREAAEQQLRNMGPQILKQVENGRRNDDPEIADRCAKLVTHFRRMQLIDHVRNDNLAVKAPSDFPLWDHFKAVAGTSKSSRDLFIKMIQDDERYRLLDESDSQKKKAENNYSQLVAGLAERGWKNWQPEGNETPPAPTIAEIATALYLGTIDTTADVNVDRNGRKAPAERFALLGAEFYRDGLKSASSEPLKKLYVGWLSQRKNPDVLQYGLDRTLGWSIDGALPIARRILKEEKTPMKLRISAMTVVGKFGSDREDGSTMKKFWDDETVIHQVKVNGQTLETQIRDVAIAVALNLKGKKPSAYGFRTFTGIAFDWGQTAYNGSFSAFPTGFASTDDRNGAHDRAYAVIGKSK